MQMCFNKTTLNFGPLIYSTMPFKYQSDYVVCKPNDLHRQVGHIVLIFALKKKAVR